MKKKRTELTLSAEFFDGMKVTAYMEDVETALGNTCNRFSTHWSTPGKGAKNLKRLFDEDQVNARIAEAYEEGRKDEQERCLKLCEEWKTKAHIHSRTLDEDKRNMYVASASAAMCIRNAIRGKE